MSIVSNASPLINRARIDVLSGAKHKGLIHAVKPYLDALRDIAGFRVSDALYRRVLQDEGEA
jgi:predicted nucleic acid-binding protein